MEESTAVIIDVEFGIETDTSPHRDELWSPSTSSSATRVAEDDGANTSSAVSAAGGKVTYTTVPQETTPLLHNSEHMSAQLSSPIEIAGIGAGRPWLRALEAMKKPWWETPSVSVAGFLHPE